MSAARHGTSPLSPRDSLGRPLTGADINVHSLLQGAETRRQPYLIGEIADVCGLDIACDADSLSISERVIAA